VIEEIDHDESTDDDDDARGVDFVTRVAII